MERYTDRTQLGVSKSGPVFKAADTQTGQAVIIKQLPSNGQAAHPCDAQTLLQLAPQLAALRGFNIASTLEITPVPDGMEVVSEFIEGAGGLQHPEKGKMPTRMAVDILNQLVHAIAEGERMGLLHGDLKPSNLRFGTMADGRVHVKVTDWALAQTRSSQPQETLIFLAPERLDGSGPTVRSELFTAGATIYYLLTGFTLVNGKSAAEIQAAWGRAKPEALKKIRKDLHSKLVKLVISLLELRPEKRPGSTAEVMRALAELNPPPLPQPAAPARQPGTATQPMRPGGRVTQPMRPAAAATQPIRSTMPAAQPVPVSVPIVPLQPPASVLVEAQPPTSSVPVVAMRPPPQIAAQLNLPEPAHADPLAFPPPPPGPESAPPAWQQMPVYQQPIPQQAGFAQGGYPQPGYGRPPQMGGGRPGVRMPPGMMLRQKPKSSLPLVIAILSVLTLGAGGYFLFQLWSAKKAEARAEAKSGQPLSTSDLQAKLRAAGDLQKAEKEAGEKGEKK
ncbi:MAG: protein kinase [Verrucomicrobiales bacterium]|nr:protein kinase [Verrucomicrobiales bacterium]